MRYPVITLLPNFGPLGSKHGKKTMSKKIYSLSSIAFYYEIVVDLWDDCGNSTNFSLFQQPHLLTLFCEQEEIDYNTSIFEFKMQEQKQILNYFGGLNWFLEEVPTRFYYNRSGQQSNVLQKLLEKPTAFLFECMLLGFSDYERENNVWFIPALIMSEKFDINPEPLKEPNLFIQHLILSGAIDVPIKPSSFSSYIFTTLTEWYDFINKPTVVRPVPGILFNNYLFVQLHVRFFSFLLLAPKIQRRFSKVRSIYGLTDFCFDKIKNTGYIFPAAGNNFSINYDTHTPSWLNDNTKFQPITPSTKLKKIFTKPSWDFVLTLPTRLILFVLPTANCFAVQIHIQPQCFWADITAVEKNNITSTYLVNKHNGLILTLIDWSVVRKNSQNIPQLGIRILQNNLLPHLGVESPNNFYDIIYDLLPLAKFKFLPSKATIKNEIPEEKNNSINESTDLTVSSVMLSSANETTNCTIDANNILLNPYQNEKLIIKNSPLITYFDKDAPKIFETKPNNFKNPPHSSPVAISLSNRLTHPFIRTTKLGVFESFTSTLNQNIINNTRTPQFIFEFDQTNKQKTAEENKENPLYTNLRILYRHWYQTFDFSIYISGLVRSKQTFKTANNIIPWRIFPSSIIYVNFLTDLNISSKKSWLKFMVFYFFEPDTTRTKFRNVIAQFQQALNLTPLSDSIHKPKRSWIDFINKYWYIKYGLLDLFSSRLAPTHDDTPRRLPLLTPLDVQPEIRNTFENYLPRNLWLESESALGNQFFLLVQHIGNEIKFDIEKKEEFDFMTFIKYFISAYINDFVLLSSLPHLKKLHPLFQDATGTTFAIEQKTELEYFLYVKKELFNYIFNSVLEEAVKFFETENSIYVHDLKETEKFYNLVKTLVENPADYLLKYHYKNKIKLLGHSLPKRGRKKQKVFKLSTVGKEYFDPVYTTAPFLKCWQKKNLIVYPKLFLEYQTKYIRIEELVVSLRTKLVLSNVSTHMIQPLSAHYKSYTQAYEWRKLLEYPTYPWVQCSKLDLLKYLIYYYIECIPNSWYKKNKPFLISLSNSGILGLKKNISNKTDLKLILAFYLYELTFSTTQTQFQNAYIFRLFSKWKTFKYHYGENEIIKQFMIGLVTDEFTRYNLAECSELWELSNSLKGKPSRYFKYSDKWLDPETSGVGYFYPGYFIRLCRAQLANYLYADFLKFIAHDNIDVFSKYSKLPFLGDIQCYNPNFLAARLKTFHTIDKKILEPIDKFNLQSWEKKYSITEKDLQQHQAIIKIQKKTDKLP